jgi:hypothetical protein
LSDLWLAIFCAPKPFTGAAALHQWNAINSWRRLGRGIEILVLGNEPGIEEVAVELSVRHVREVERSAFGTPLVSSLFRVATDVTHAPLLCYINADIILLSSFVRSVRRVPFPRFLLSGRRLDTPIDGRLDFASLDWEAGLRHWTQENGSLHAASAMDYFVFPRGLLERVPDFAVGRAYWDSWLVFHARSLGIPVIDASGAIMAVHQNHDYGHVPGGEVTVWKGLEAQRNRELAEEMLFPFTLEDATWELTSSGLHRRVPLFQMTRLLQAEIAVWMRRRRSGRRILRKLLRARFV